MLKFEATVPVSRAARAKPLLVGYHSAGPCGQTSFGRRRETWVSCWVCRRRWAPRLRGCRCSSARLPSEHLTRRRHLRTVRGSWHLVPGLAVGFSGKVTTPLKISREGDSNGRGSLGWTTDQLLS